MKKYRLLKDTHKGKAGLIVVWDYRNEAYFGNSQKDDYYSREEVEDNPDWFKDISETWEWTDKLVNEYVQHCVNHVFTNDGTDVKKEWFMGKFKSAQNLTTTI